MQPQRLTHNIDRPLKPARSNTIRPADARVELLPVNCRAWFLELGAIARAVMPHCGLPPG
jgi:hypothetical protein